MGTFDSGTVKLTIGTTSFTVSYGQGSTTSTIANALSCQINAATTAPVTAPCPATGNGVLLTARTAGAAGNNLTLSSTVTFDRVDFTVASFAVSRSGATLTGGQDAVPPTTVYDTGTVTITVNGSPQSVSYGQTSTATSIASALTTVLSSSPWVNASLAGTTISLTSKATGVASNYSLSASSVTNSSSFTGTSFPVVTSGGTLTGGQDAVPGGLGAPWITLYQYNLLDDFRRVDQKGGDPTQANWRTRTFTYDSLAQLKCAANPEIATVTCPTVDTGSYPTGAVVYGYDNDGNLVSKTDGRGIVINYSPAANPIDPLHRVKQKTYTNGDPSVSYSYDSGTNGIGRRTGMTDASGSSSWTYDPMGRMASESHTISGFSKTISNLYNLDGSIQQITYPTGSGSIVAYTYNNAGRVTMVKDTAHNITYFQTAAYYPPGQLNQATFGSVVETSIYNSRLQPCWFYATTGTALAASTLCGGTASAATLLDLKYNFGFGANNNGNILGVTNNKDSNRSVTYTCDQLNRIASAATPNSDCSVVTGTSLTKNWGETFTIDPWGNLTARNVNKCSADGMSQGVLNNNRLSGFGYDAAGNMTSNGGANYTYNAESQLVTAGGVTYTYDGDGNRVKKSNDTMYWGTGPLLESNGSGNLQREFIFADGKRIARRDISGGAVHYYFADNLGSTDVVATSAGTLENDSAYYPYGGERAYLTNLASQNYKFNGKERDSESGLDEFGARYYTNAVGRFMIPDWAAKPTTVPYANFGNPQSLNLYSYVQNNPTTLGDPDGHEIIYDPNLKNAQVVKDSVQAILANPHTSDNLSGYVGPNNPDLFIKNDDLSDHDSSKYSPDGTPGASITKGSTDPGGLQTTTSSSTDINGVTTTSAPEISGSATITIDNRTSKGDTPSVLVHESVHAGEARKDPAQFGKDAAAEKKADPNCHDCRPQEQRANAAQKAYGNEINKAVKQIEKDRKNANK